LPQYDPDRPGTRSSHLPMSGCQPQSRPAGFAGESRAQISLGECNFDYDRRQKQLVVVMGENPCADIYPVKSLRKIYVTAKLIASQNCNYQILNFEQFLKVLNLSIE
jgi:hypothetical protein